MRGCSQTKYKQSSEIFPVNSLLFWKPHAQKFPVFPVMP